MDFNQKATIISIIGISVMISILLVLAGQNSDVEPIHITEPEYLQYSVDELLGDPSLIPLRDKDGRYIHIEPDGIGLEFTCASISVKRLSDDYVQKELSRQHDSGYFSINDNDLEDVPELKVLIAATHQVKIPYNDSVQVYLDGLEFVKYEFFLADKLVDKYGGERYDYFVRFNEDYEERFANPKTQGFSNEFLAPDIIYQNKTYGIGGTVFWTSDEHKPMRMSVHLNDSIKEDEKFITLDDKDMHHIPKIKDGIEGIGTVQEYVMASKSLPEPVFDRYFDWYEYKSMQNFDDHALGFEYDDEYYELSFAIC